MKKILLSVTFFLIVICSSNAQMLLSIDIQTGSDDLRGGNDNVNLIILMKSGTQVRFDNLNNGSRLGNDTKTSFTRIMSSGKPADISTIRLETTVAGGIGGDNWNLNSLLIHGVVSNVATKLIDVSGNPVFRFTGSQRVKDFTCLTAGTTNPVNAGPVMTRFIPSTHGFKFINQFSNVVLSQLDIVEMGLCAGMTYSALDYYKSNRKIPQQPYMPAEGMPLQVYISDRHSKANSMYQAKRAEYFVNPGGVRNREFFTWGIQAGSGQLGTLMSFIDKGEPVPISLISCGSGCSGNHAVVAVGYQLGYYNGNPVNSNSIGDLTIFVYDPNKPGETMQLKPDNANSYFYYTTCPGNCRWRTYFVHSGYTYVNPPVIPDNPKELVVEFVTGRDDLRGGNDNVNVVVTCRNRAGTEYKLRFDNVNNGKRWVINSSQSISRPLPDAFINEDIRRFLIETTFSGGIGGDNWNMNKVVFSTRINGTVVKIFEKSGDPVCRFTGAFKAYDIQVR